MNQKIYLHEYIDIILQGRPKSANETAKAIPAGRIALIHAAEALKRKTA